MLHLTFADHVHRLNAGEDDASTPEILESHHGPGAAFERPMILRDTSTSTARALRRRFHPYF